MLENDDSLIAVGKRLNILRTMAGWDRDGLSRAANVSAASISYWENASGGVISAKSMGKLIEAFLTVGISCSEDWLRKGEGEKPFQPSQSQQNPLNENLAGQDISNFQFNKEIAMFLSVETQKGRQEKIVTTIENSAMTPVFEKGDIVGGILLPAHSVDLSKEQMCIIKLDGKLDVRRVKKGNSPSTFNLSYFSYDQDCHFPLEMNDVHLEHLAPIIRVWR